MARLEWQLEMEDAIRQINEAEVILKNGAAVSLIYVISFLISSYVYSNVQ